MLFQVAGRLTHYSIRGRVEREAREGHNLCDQVDREYLDREDWDGPVPYRHGCETEEHHGELGHVRCH